MNCEVEQMEACGVRFQRLEEGQARLLADVAELKESVKKLLIALGVSDRKSTRRQSKC